MHLKVHVVLRMLFPLHHDVRDDRLMFSGLVIRHIRVGHIETHAVCHA